MSGHAGETRGLKITLVAYSAIFIIQLTTFLGTGILVLFAQALEVLGDVLVSSFLILSLFWSQKPADQFYMFGRGRTQNVAALVSSVVFISFMSFEVFRQAIEKFFQPEVGELGDVNLGLMVIAISMLVLAIPMIDILRVKTKGASAKAGFVQLLKDEISYVPALVGVYLLGQGYYLADAVTSMIIGVIIVVGGLYLFKDNFNYLVGRAPDRQYMEKVKSVANSVKGVLGVHDLIAEYVGPNMIHTGFHIEVARGTPIEKAGRISEEVHEKVQRATNCHHCVIHVDPVKKSGK
nr:cation diffusion facilitator family transporter [Candidatus Njordarchaeota archaeon]